MIFPSLSDRLNTDRTSLILLAKCLSGHLTTEPMLSSDAWRSGLKPRRANRFCRHQGGVWAWGYPGKPTLWRFLTSSSTNAAVFSETQVGLRAMLPSQI